MGSVLGDTVRKVLAQEVAPSPRGDDDGRVGKSVREAANHAVGAVDQAVEQAALEGVLGRGTDGGGRKRPERDGRQLRGVAREGAPQQGRAGRDGAAFVDAPALRVGADDLVGQRGARVERHDGAGGAGVMVFAGVVVFAVAEPGGSGGGQPVGPERGGRAVAQFKGQVHVLRVGADGESVRQAPALAQGGAGVLGSCWDDRGDARAFGRRRYGVPGYGVPEGLLPVCARGRRGR